MENQQEVLPTNSRTSNHQNDQSFRSHLRRQFLSMLSSMHKKNIKLYLYECDIPLSAKFQACQPSMDHFLVSDLQTPIGVQKWALIRTSDVVEIHFDIQDS